MTRNEPSPQVDDGFIRIALELFDAICSIRIPGEARQVFDVILRKTYGWHKKKDRISLSQFSIITNINKRNVLRAIDTLIKMNIIIVEKDNKPDALYCIQKNYSTWVPLSKKTPVVEKDNTSLSKKTTPIIRNTKDTSTKDKTPYSPPFEKFWVAYPRKTGKKEALKAWNKINMDDILFDKILKSLIEQKKHENLPIDRPKYIPHASTWLNQERWNDEIVYKEKSGRSHYGDDKPFPPSEEFY